MSERLALRAIGFGDSLDGSGAVLIVVDELALRTVIDGLRLSDRKYPWKKDEARSGEEERMMAAMLATVGVLSEVSKNPSVEKDVISLRLQGRFKRSVGGSSSFAKEFPHCLSLER